MLGTWHSLRSTPQPLTGELNPFSVAALSTTHCHTFARQLHTTSKPTAIYRIHFTFKIGCALTLRAAVGIICGWCSLTTSITLTFFTDNESLNIESRCANPLICIAPMSLFPFIFLRSYNYFVETIITITGHAHHQPALHNDKNSRTAFFVQNIFTSYLHSGMFESLDQACQELPSWCST